MKVDKVRTQMMPTSPQLFHSDAHYGRSLFKQKYISGYNWRIVHQAPPHLNTTPLIETHTSPHTATHAAPHAHAQTHARMLARTHTNMYLVTMCPVIMLRHDTLDNQPDQSNESRLASAYATAIRTWVCVYTVFFFFVPKYKNETTKKQIVFVFCFQI